MNRKLRNYRLANDEQRALALKIGQAEETLNSLLKEAKDAGIDVGMSCVSSPMRAKGYSSIDVRLQLQETLSKKEEKS